jgi:hypothetical protein
LPPVCPDESLFTPWDRRRRSSSGGKDFPTSEREGAPRVRCSEAFRIDSPERACSCPAAKTPTTSFGAAVVPLTLYRKTARNYDASLDGEIAARPPAVFFASSPSAARWFFEGASPASVRLLRVTPAIALGEPTEQALLSRGTRRVSIARPPTFESAARLAVRLAAAGPPA